MKERERKRGRMHMHAATLLQARGGALWWYYSTSTHRRSRILRHLLGISDAGAPNQTGMYANIAIGLAADRGQRCQCELEKENDIFFVFCTQPKNINSLPMEILHCAHLEAGQQEMQNNLTRSTRQQLHQQYVSGFYFLVSLFFYWTEEIEGNLHMCLICI